ncbi:amino acid/polyamine transporter I [Rhodofomes roseus]|uniref:Amino acid/polyamine transporter I n=1 Tax=Rhodofomes roseus TaxID=34475 RepID=A0ABQ8K3V2_9APHY|nr:amino acid/polyamine transporter I [Rhodofomes roseus]KAH9831363.1 amino acid/polyamine transporter I [Rhodofomes roseus]
MSDELPNATDDARLAELGYKTQFKRGFTLIDATAFSFSIMAVISGVSSTMGLTIASGGHVGLIWGWLIPVPFVICVAAVMAELASSMPTSAGPYYYAAKLAPKRYAPLASWVVGGANLTGHVTLLTYIDFALAQMITTAIAAGTDGRVALGHGPTFGLFLAMLVLHGCICSATTRALARLSLVSAIFKVGATVAAIIILPVCTGENRVSTRVAFTSYENSTGWSNSGWAFLLAFTGPMWQLAACNRLRCAISEETARAAKVAPMAMLMSVACAGCLGWIFNIATSFAVASVPDLLSSPFPLPMGQLYFDIMGKRGMLAIWCVTIVVQFMRGAAQGVTASRVVFAFARDNALPGAHRWKKINHYTRTPVNAVWLAVSLAAFFGLLGFSSIAMTSAACATVIGLYTSYAIPILLRITTGRNKFVPGPFSLGRWSTPMGTIAIAWIAFVILLLCFPRTQSPHTSNMNYAVVLTMGISILAYGVWAFSARNWFTGPLQNIDDNDSNNTITQAFGEMSENAKSTQGL